MLTLLTVGSHQPFSAPPPTTWPAPSAKQAAVAYLDDAIDAFLADRRKRGVLRDTLVGAHFRLIPRCSMVRLTPRPGASNLVLAPGTGGAAAGQERRLRPVDLAASVLDYFSYHVPGGISGRSLFRDYASGREMMSYNQRHAAPPRRQGHLRPNAISSRSARRLPSEGLHRPTKPSSSVASAGRQAPPGQPSARRRPRPLQCNRPASWARSSSSPPTNASA